MTDPDGFTPTDRAAEGEMMAELQDRLDNPPAPWMPTPNDDPPEEAITEPRVFGIVAEAEVRTGDFGPYPWIVLRNPVDNSRVAVSGFGTVLGGRLGSVAVGDGVAIEYRGTKVPRNAKPGASPYHDYAVQVIHKGGTPPLIAPASELADMEVEDGVFMSELDRETLEVLADSSVSPVMKARARAWAERAER
jgi:hypothetical protein